MNYKLLAHGAIGTLLILESFGPDFKKYPHNPTSLFVGLLL